MEAQELLDASDLGTAVFVIKSSTRAAFDAAEIIGLANARFHGVRAASDMPAHSLGAPATLH